MKTPVKLTQQQRCIANRKLSDTMKMSKGCETCGYNANPAALQWDHLDPNTKFRTKNGNAINPSTMVYYSQALMLAEFAKCRVLCANCHAIHTVEQTAELRQLGLLRTRGKSNRKLSVVPDKIAV